MFVLARRNTIQHGRAMNRHGERNQDTIVKYQTQEHTINVNTARLNTPQRTLLDTSHDEKKLCQKCKH